MKKLIGLILFINQLLFLNSITQAQSDSYTFTSTDGKIIDTANIVALYDLEFKEDTNNLQKTKYQPFMLLLGDTFSLFIGENVYKSDSLQDAMNGRKFGSFQEAYDFVSSQAPEGRFKFRIYKNYQKQEITFTDMVIPNQFLYHEPLDCFNWTIEKDYNDSIGKFPVKKATTWYGGRNWEAFFTPSIPINDGPYKFNGLPGLILKVNDTQHHYVFTLSSIYQVTYRKDITLPDRSYVVTTKDQYLKSYQNFRYSFIDAANEANIPTESQVTIARNLQRRNNYIELIFD
jgi:GLPGLI family protein